jgi:hypothetical protein
VEKLVPQLEKLTKENEESEFKFKILKARHKKEKEEDRLRKIKVNNELKKLKEIEQQTNKKLKYTIQEAMEILNPKTDAQKVLYTGNQVFNL